MVQFDGGLPTAIAIVAFALISTVLLLWLFLPRKAVTSASTQAATGPTPAEAGEVDEQQRSAAHSEGWSLPGWAKTLIKWGLIIAGLLLLLWLIAWLLRELDLTIGGKVPRLPVSTIERPLFSIPVPAPITVMAPPLSSKECVLVELPKGACSTFWASGPVSSLAMLNAPQGSAGSSDWVDYNTLDVAARANIAKECYKSTTEAAHEVRLTFKAYTANCQ